MNYTITTEALLCLIAFVASLIAYPIVLAIAKEHNIMDNPNARKLQRNPVPVMGGIAVFIGILVPVLIFNITINDRIMWVGALAMVIMLVVGLIDDIWDISAVQRFILELGLMYGVIVATKMGINSLDGLWGVYDLPLTVLLPLSLISGVGIINSINLIDGVDGYSSGFCTMACMLFGIYAYQVGDILMGRMAVICAGALLPFFLHNVFGDKSKMYIGDSGTLMLGTMLVMFVFRVMSRDVNGGMGKPEDMGLVPFTLAVMSIPVFDTLRVMFVRIYRGRSPFHPDKTHLHHLFIDLGFSHIGTTVFILTINFMVVVVWFLAWKLGASIDTQLYIVVGMSILTTFGFYHFMRLQYNRGPLDENGRHLGNRLWRFFCVMGDLSHFERRGIWGFMRKLMDGYWWSKEKRS